MVYVKPAPGCAEKKMPTASSCMPRLAHRPNKKFCGTAPELGARSFKELAATHLPQWWRHALLVLAGLSADTRASPPLSPHVFIRSDTRNRTAEAAGGRGHMRAPGKQGGRQPRSKKTHTEDLRPCAGGSALRAVAPLFAMHNVMSFGCFGRALPLAQRQHPQLMCPIHSWLRMLQMLYQSVLEWFLMPNARFGMVSHRSEAIGRRIGSVALCNFDPTD